MTVTEAIDFARDHLTAVLPELAEGPQLEELETPPAGLKWRFTFSATLPQPDAPSLSQLMRGWRVTKTVEIDPQTGALLSIRNNAG